MSCFRRTVFILAAIRLQSSVSVSMYMFSNISNLVLVAVNIGIKVHKWNFIGDNLGGGQFICRETCCFDVFGSEKYFAGKRKMAETIFKAQPSLFCPHFDFTLMNVYTSVR